ncbi:12964_t:CDS:1 [Acaulospora colombiana]|uniref:12964_t:CDS:1 n=1 Tax=Acaulospora colombiana TaxID=27376 RepID=A0ACA9M5I2_9GLOM|nr:12964_t:CDS:1 [Acaulospora colombiana]
MSENTEHSKNSNIQRATQRQSGDDRPKRPQTSLPDVQTLSSLTLEPYVDTHTHLHYVIDRLPEKFGVDSYQDLKDRYCPPNMEACINVLCDPQSFNTDQVFPGTYSDWKVMADTGFIYLTAGVHPHNSKDYNDFVEDRMVEILQHPKTVALGEIGLDYHYDFSPRDVQRRIFVKQIELAKAMAKPIVIHTREAESDTWEILIKHIPQDWKIHVHCFTDSPQFAKRLLNHFSNLYIGITGVVTFGSARNTQEVVRSVVPLNRILLETDAPYMVPAKLNKNKRTAEKVNVCHSGMIPFVAQRISELMGKGINEVMQAARENARNMYGV